MAWQFVGSTTANGNGATSYAVSLNGTLTGGIASSPAEGDLVVVFFGTAGTATATYTATGNNSSTYQATTAVGYSNDTWDSIFRAMFQVMGATPDTSITITRANNTTYGGACVVHVWRGVDAASPYIGGLNASASNQNGAALNPPSYDPAVADALVISGGMGTFAPADTAGYTGFGSVLSNNRTSYGNGTTADVGVIMGSALYGGSAIDPPIATGGNQANASSSWVGVTLGFRMQPDVTPVSNDLNGSYNITTEVSNDLAASFTVRQEVSSDLAASYNVLNWVQSDLSASYAVQELAPYRINVRWMAFEVASNVHVTKDLIGSYNVISQVQKDLSSSYTVLNTAEKDLAASFTVNQLATNDLGATYNVLQTAEKDLASTYTVLANVNKDLTASFTLIGRVTSDLAATYQVSQATGTVANDLSVSYTVHNIVQSDLSVSYTLRNSVQKDLTGEFTVFNTVAKDLTGAYAVINTITKDLSSNYTVFNTAYKDLSVNYTMIGRVGNDLISSYNVLQLNVQRVYFGAGAYTNPTARGTRTFIH